jgi:spore coat protein U-like protein
MKIMLKIFCLLFLSTSAVSACLLSFDLVNTSWTMGIGSYQTFETTEYIQSVQVDVNVDTQGDCNYFLSFSDGGEVSYARLAVATSNSLSYNMYKDITLNNILKDSTDFISSSDVLSGSVSTGNTGIYTHTLYFNVPKQQIEESGTYTDTLAVSLYEGLWNDLENAVLIESQDVVFSVPVASSQSISLENNNFELSGSITKEMGVLSNNAYKDIQIYIQSNDGYRLTLQSENSQTMIAGEPNETPLPYTFTVDTVPVDLSSGTQVNAVLKPSPTNQSGTLYVGRLTVPDVSDVFWGDYSDTITFGVMSL